MNDDLRHQLDNEEAVARAAQTRARHAKNLLENPLLTEAINAVKDQLYKDFATSPIEDDRARLQARVGVDMLDRVLKYVKMHVEKGKVADKAIVEIDRKRGQLRRRVA